MKLERAPHKLFKVLSGPSKDTEGVACSANLKVQKYSGSKSSISWNQFVVAKTLNYHLSTWSCGECWKAMYWQFYVQVI